MQHREYTRRVNSNGEEVSPSVCASYFKAPQRQADNSGGYVLDFFKGKSRKCLYPLETDSESVVQCTATNPDTRTTKQGKTNG